MRLVSSASRSSRDVLAVVDAHHAHALGRAAWTLISLTRIRIACRGRRSDQ